MVKKVAGNDGESGWNLEWEEEKRRGRKRREEEEEEGGCFGGMRLNDAIHELGSQTRVMGWLDQPPRVH
jgi:hypothetical protein